MSDVLLIDNTQEQSTILIPVTAVQPDLVTQTDTVVYVPLASKTAHGIVKIGEGLNITDNGVLSFDRSEVTIKYIAKNGEDLTPDENKRVNITLDKTDVGLNNVNNTADEDKPISKPQQAEFDRINGLIKGAEKAISFSSYSEMISVLNDKSKDDYNIGQTIFIGTHDVPDVWIYGVDDVSEKYTYTTDYDIVENFYNNKTIKVGYYVLSALESKQIDISNYVTLDTKQTIEGDKNFIGALRKDGMNVATIDDINSVTLDTLSFQPDENGLLYVNDKAYYQGRFIYTTQKDVNTPISVSGVLELPIKGRNVMLSSDGTYLTLDSDYSGLVDTTTQQTIYGTKLFNTQIGIVNEENNDVNFLKHINNNFLLSASNGQNILNIDEQLKTIHFYNKPLATEEYGLTQYVSFKERQELTDEEKLIARENIGAGTGEGTSQGTNVINDNGEILSSVYLTNDNDKTEENSVLTLSALKDNYVRTSKTFDMTSKYGQNVIHTIQSDILRGNPTLRLVNGTEDYTTSYAEISLHHLYNSSTNYVSPHISMYTYKDNVSENGRLHDSTFDIYTDKTVIKNTTWDIDTNSDYGVTMTLASDVTSSSILALDISNQTGNKRVFTVDSERVKVAGNLEVSGNIIQKGSSYETHAEQIYSTNDYITLRDGAISSLGDGYAGFQFKKYDGTNDGRLVVDAQGVARVGDVGDEQPLATREETPLAGGIAVWDDGAYKFITTNNIGNEISFTTTPKVNDVPLALSNNVVDLTSLQWIDGIKAFNKDTYLKDTVSSYLDNPTTATYRSLIIQGRDNKEIAKIFTQVGNGWNGLNLQLRDKNFNASVLEFVADTAGWRFDPVQHNTVSLGANTRRWSNLYIAGKAEIAGDIDGASNVNVSKNLNVTGDANITGKLNLASNYNNYPHITGDAVITMSTNGAYDETAGCYVFEQSKFRPALHRTNDQDFGDANSRWRNLHLGGNFYDYGARAFAGRYTADTGTRYFEVARCICPTTYRGVSAKIEVHDFDQPSSCIVEVESYKGALTAVPQCYIGVTETSGSSGTATRWNDRFYLVANYVTDGTTPTSQKVLYQIFYKTIAAYEAIHCRFISEESDYRDKAPTFWTKFDNTTAASALTAIPNNFTYEDIESTLTGGVVKQVIVNDNIYRNAGTSVSPYNNIYASGNISNGTSSISVNKLISLGTTKHVRFVIDHNQTKVGTGTNYLKGWLEGGSESTSFTFTSSGRPILITGEIYASVVNGTGWCDLFVDGSPSKELAGAFINTSHQHIPLHAVITLSAGTHTLSLVATGNQDNTTINIPQWAYTSIDVVEI